MINRQRQFDALVRQYSTDLYRYAVWLSRDRETAEDLVQETFVRAWKGLAALRDEKAAKSWLVTILRRENARLYERKRLEFADVEPFSVADREELQPESRREIGLLREGIQKLDRKYREPLTLQVVGGFSCAEIAEILGIGKGAVMTQLFRARNKLKEMLAPTAENDRDNVHELY